MNARVPSISVVHRMQRVRLSALALGFVWVSGAAAQTPAQGNPTTGSSPNPAPVAAPSAGHPGAEPGASASDACFPACRTGYVCHRGQCISACNPPCAPNEQCTGAGICQAQSAVAPGGAVQPAATPSMAAQPAAAPPTNMPTPAGPFVPPGEGAQDGPFQKSVVGITSDVGGAITYGPTLSLEFGGPATFFVRTRLVSLGLAANLVAASSNDSLKFSYGLGAGFRYFFGTRGSRQGFYVGAAAEYLRTESREGDSYYDSRNIRYITSGVVGMSEIGYRWLFNKGFSLGVGGTLGYWDISSADTKADGAIPSGYHNDMTSQIVVMPNLELGFAL